MAIIGIGGLTQFSRVLSATSTAVSTGALGSTGAQEFGFLATHLKMAVDASGPAYLRFNGITTASTSDFILTTGDGLREWFHVGTVGGMTITATSTAMSIRIGAWG